MRIGALVGLKIIMIADCGLSEEVTVQKYFTIDILFDTKWQAQASSVVIETIAQRCTPRDVRRQNQLLPL